MFCFQTPFLIVNSREPLRCIPTEIPNTKILRYTPAANLIYYNIHFFLYVFVYNILQYTSACRKWYMVNSYLVANRDYCRIHCIRLVPFGVIFSFQASACAGLTRFENVLRPRFLAKGKLLLTLIIIFLFLYRHWPHQTVFKHIRVT